MAEMFPPKKNTAFTLVLTIRDADGDLVTGATALDSEVSIDGAGFNDCTNEATEIGTTGIYTLVLTSGEMNGDVITVQTKTTSSGAKTAVNVIYTAVRTIADLAFPATTGRSMVVDANGLVDANTVKVGPTAGGTAQTAGDIPARLPAALTANGNMKSSMVEILTTALTETAGLLAGGFKKFFNVAAPTGTLLSIPDAVPDAVGGLPVTGTRLTAIPTLPVALVGGRIDSSVGAIAANAITTASIADGALTAAKFAADAFDAVWAVAVRTLTAFGFGVTVTTNNDKTDYSLANGSIAAATFAANALDAVWSTAVRLLSAGTNIVLAKGVGVTGFNDLSAAQVNAEADTALVDYDAATGAEAVAIAGQITALNDVSAAQINAALKAEGYEGAITFEQIIRVLLAFATGETSGFIPAVPNDVEFRNPDGSVLIFHGHLDANRNRTTAGLDI